MIPRAVIVAAYSQSLGIDTPAGKQLYARIMSITSGTYLARFRKVGLFPTPRKRWSKARAVRAARALWLSRDLDLMPPSVWLLVGARVHAAFAHPSPSGARHIWRNDVEWILLPSLSRRWTNKQVVLARACVRTALPEIPFGELQEALDAVAVGCHEQRRSAE